MANIIHCIFLTLSPLMTCVFIVMTVLIMLSVLMKMLNFVMYWRQNFLSSREYSNNLHNNEYIIYMGIIDELETGVWNFIIELQ